MPYPELKNEKYQSFGGINTKISSYLTGQMEFLNLKNVDFQTPGDLTKRWGSTQYFGASLSGKIDGLYEFTQTSGASFLYAAAGGTLGLATSGGFSSIYSSSTAGTSYFISFGASNVDRWTLGASLNLDFDTLNNQAYFANRKSFLKSISGASVLFFGLPRPQFNYFNPNFIPSNYLIGVGSSGVADGFTGIFYYKLAWINSYGMAGAPTIAGTAQYNSFAVTQGATQIVVSVAGGNTNTVSVPPNFDISALGFFRAGPFPGTTLALPIVNSTAFNGDVFKVYQGLENQVYTYQGSVGVSAGSKGITFVDTNVGSGITTLNLDTLPWNWYQFLEYPSGGFTTFGLTAIVGFGITAIPSMVEIQDSRLFAAGMSYAPSTVSFSDFNEPEHWEPDFNFEVRTNDGEPITALKAYSGNLTVFKTTSFHALSTAADDPANWQIVQISAEYGCLGNRAVTEYENYIVFLDQKGVIQYNGANIEILSTKVDPIFARMNLAACRDNSCITYDKQRNEILIDIPVDGSTTANLTVVYDIISKAWTTYEGYRPSITTTAQGNLANKTAFFGSYSGLVSYFGQSFLTDNGIGYTAVIKSGFLADLGHSVAKLFRRLFLDVVPFGASSAIDINLYQDYGSSIIINRTMYQTPFQSRLEYGISGKSMAVEFVMGSTYGLQLHGFTIEYRFLRNL